MNDYNKYSDAELAGLFRTGDDAAFKEIYNRYSQLLYLYALKRLHNKEDSTDIVHDIFAALLSNRQKFILSTTLSGFLYKSVLNKIFDIYRHKDVIKQYVDSGHHYIDIDSTETDYLIREKEITALIDKEIAAMPPKMKEIYQLKTEGNLSVKDIASQLGLSEHTVSTQIKRAMKHLKTNLGVFIYVIYILKP
ncbi:RNA polymerase sigma-70 factor (family 1) [Pedobacter africanus]|uniref:RNA polymerase sigma factor n=1 Tax=Pedobacter africanus TaxID=151894 RepID=UPI003392EBBA